MRCALCFAELCVPAAVYTFQGPRSATGEDVVEYHLPGNALLARMLLDELVRHGGARRAEPGEFTARAYFNGRVDLAEAEGVAATIAAQNERELDAARRLLSGELARRLRPITDLLAEALGLVEAGIDFSEEDISFITSSDAALRVRAARDAMTSLVRDSTRFERLAHEPAVVLIGRPNAGKSTLLNALAGTERAIVSPHAGTTRDAIWAHVRLPRGIVRMIDVAGLDDSRESEIDRKMRAIALHALETADVVVLVREAPDDRPPPHMARAADVSVVSKDDLRAARPVDAPATIAVSAVTGAGLSDLRDRLDAMCFGGPGGSGETALALNVRHVECIDDAIEAIDRAAERISAGDGCELLALELREALDALGQILGSVTPDDVLGRIFSSFCIGK